MIKTGERNNRGCYGNTCCTILFLVVWAFYWLLGSLDPRPIRLQLNARSPTRPGIDCIVFGRDLGVVF